MKKFIVPAAAALALLLAACSSPYVSKAPSGDLAAEFGSPELAGEPIPGRYIVVMADGVLDDASVQSFGLSVQGVAAELGVQAVLPLRIIDGFVAESVSAQRLEALRADPRVAYVEQDQVVRLDATQTNATWGLDRVDQRDLPLDGAYTYTADGTGVTAYIVDTGIRGDHAEFAGRLAAGYTSINDGNGTEDCNGHGTHVAGTVGGSTYGVAKDVTLVPVRVLDCNGSGTNSGVIAGVDWVTQNASGPSVANMSLGGGASTALDDAVAASVAAGVFYAVAAGNDGGNACSKSPARVDSALTVGSTTSTDARSSFSNYGTCVDLFAPGSSITSAWHTSSSATNTISGTSMATPHAAGAAALYLEGNGSATPAQVVSHLTSNASSGRISNPGTGSPDLLLYTGSEPDTAPPPPPPGCGGCETYTGTLSGPGDYDYQPDGTYFYSGSGTHTGDLTGPAGTDFDLYLWKWNGWFGWVTVASSTSSDSTEAITYNGSSGYYVWRIESYSGSGAYTFEMMRP